MYLPLILVIININSLIPALELLLLLFFFGFRLAEGERKRNCSWHRNLSTHERKGETAWSDSKILTK